MRLAIDTGGTFTDCVCWCEGELRVLKVPSTPADPSRAVLDAIAAIPGSAGAEVRHGSTVATNALLERKGARVAFVTTAGFEDTVEIGRQARPNLYRWCWEDAPSLAPREMRFGIHERVLADGSILHAADDDELAHLREKIRTSGAEAVALSFLFSFANPANERAALRHLSELGIPISASHEILPEFREYERGSTVLVNAYLAPKMQGYLERLQGGLRLRGSALHVMQSSGGIVTAEVAAREPVRTILSGPAGGVVGATIIAKQAGFSKVLTFDMGGTSTDVALIQTGAALQTTTEAKINGLPVAVPMLRIHTAGAGGGSTAKFDRAGALQVGPESAGADPGPACYGRGEDATVTDANLILGRIDPDWFLGGNMALDAQRARGILDQHKRSIATVEEFAEGIVRVADAHMENALRTISVEQGYDPRDFTLLSFGGAGPLHACALAKSLGISRVMVPKHPGALSAYGILVSDFVRDYSRTVMLQPGDVGIEENLGALEDGARRDLPDALAVYSLDMRYAGQGFELNVAWQQDYLASFHELHEKRYGYADRARSVEVVNVRLRLIAQTDRVEPSPCDLCPGNGCNAIVKYTRLYSGGNWLDAPVYDRTRLHSGDGFDGPAVVVEYSATTFVAAGCASKVDAYENLIVNVPA